MGIKMYGSYSDADLNDWERFPMNAKVLSSSAFGAWLLRRDKAILKSDYENRLKADKIDMLEKLKSEIEEKSIIDYEEVLYDGGECVISISEINDIIQQKINSLKAESER